MTSAPRFFGAVEAGGTKFVVAIGDDRGQILARERFATADPLSTLAAVESFLRQRSQAVGKLAAIGIASFGPVDAEHR
jgi:fructokinase